MFTCICNHFKRGKILARGYSLLHPSYGIVVLLPVLNRNMDKNMLIRTFINSQNACIFAT